MTFGPAFPAVFSKSFTTQLGGGAWWNAFGAIPLANCVAAYLPKGAASAAASAVNLVTPGTYDTDTPSVWDATNGWKSVVTVGSSYTIPSGTNGVTVIARYVAASTFGAIIDSSGANQFAVRIRGTTTTIAGYIGAAGSGDKTVANAYGVICLAKHDEIIYYNGGSVASAWTANTVSVGSSLLFAHASRTYIQAAAIYNTLLNGTQIAALSTAMNAL